MKNFSPRCSAKRNLPREAEGTRNGRNVNIEIDAGLHAHCDGFLGNELPIRAAARGALMAAPIGQHIDSLT
jgi:hypothetical protein